MKALMPPRPLLLLMLIAATASYSAETAAKIEPLSAVQSSEWLTEINQREELLPFSMKAKYKSLRAENCFGVLVGDKRMAGESSGQPYGIHMFSFRDGKAVSPIFVGVLHSEFPFSLAGKPLPAGGYALMVLAGTLELHGDDPAAKESNPRLRREGPKETLTEIPLKVSLPEDQLADRAPTVPAWAIRIADGRILLSIGDNTLQLKPN